MYDADPKDDHDRYARCIDISKRVRWDIERDVIRGRDFDFSQVFLPDSLSLAAELEFLSSDERRFLSQVQGRTYANMFGLIERYINAKILDISREHWFGDQVKLEALVRFSDEELKHQALFRRLDDMMTSRMPPGYRVVADPNEVARLVLGKSTWAVLALTCHIEIFTLVHYKQSIEPQANLSPLWKDVFLFHCKEEAQHAIMDELEWRREDARLSAVERDRGVDELIELVGAIDGLLVQQAAADAAYFLRNAGRDWRDDERKAVDDTMLRAYRWQYVVSGVRDGRFLGILTELIDDDQTRRVSDALAPLLG